MRAALTALAALALAPTSAMAQDATVTVDSDSRPYWSGEEGWRVFAYPDEKMCDLGFPTQSGEYVTVGHHPVEDTTTLMVTNKHATSVRAGAQMRLVVAFMDTAIAKPTSVHTVGFEMMDAGGTPALIATSTYAAFLDDFAKAGAMAVITDKTAVVSAIRLTGSDEAVRQLRACAMKAAGLDPADPFLKR